MRAGNYARLRYSSSYDTNLPLSKVQSIHLSYSSQKKTLVGRNARYQQSLMAKSKSFSSVANCREQIVIPPLNLFSSVHIFLANRRMKRECSQQRIFLKSRIKLIAPIETKNTINAVSLLTISKEEKKESVKLLTRKIALKLPLRTKQNSKFANLGKNPEVHQMAREYFAILAQMNEWQLNEFTTLERENFAKYFASIGCQDSMLIENAIEYVVRAVPKLSFSCYYRFLVEGLMSGIESFQKQISYTIYSNFKERLYLIDVYNYFEDPLWNPIMSDLLLIHEKLKAKGRIEVHNPLESYESKANIRRRTIKRRQNISFLLLKRPSFNFDTQDEEPTIMESKNTWIGYRDFAEINFPDTVPGLVFLLMRLLCGQELASYYTEQAGMRGFHYAFSSREKLVDRTPVDPAQSRVRREAQQLETKIKRVKSVVNQGIVRAAIRIFQSIKQESKAYLQKREIAREDFAAHSVPADNHIALAIWQNHQRLRHPALRHPRYWPQRCVEFSLPVRVL